jgi:hypothetical protein
MLHFAYGSNMDHTIMRQHARDAVPVGVARLADHCFIITTDGYASVERARAASVHGVLWRLTPHDRVTLDIWEGIASGRYRAATMPVRQGHYLRPALVYLGPSSGTGRPKPGYMELVLAAARAWNLPHCYLAWLQRWVRARPLGTTTRRLAEFGSGFQAAKGPQLG